MALKENIQQKVENLSPKVLRSNEKCCITGPNVHQNKHNQHTEPVIFIYKITTLENRARIFAPLVVFVDLNHDYSAPIMLSKS